MLWLSILVSSMDVILALTRYECISAAHDGQHDGPK
jgi:hypothetical protein